MWEIPSNWESMVTCTCWKFGQIAFSRAISKPSEPLNCHTWPVNTCYLSSSRVIASLLSCLMSLTFSTILHVQIILDFVACDFFFPSFLFSSTKKGKYGATHRGPSQFHRCRAIHHILSVWISNISLQQSRWCNRYGLWAHIKWIPWGYSIWLPRDIWSDY